VAGKPLLERDSCRGDSGGPAYVETNNGWFVAGATSRATKNSSRTCGDGGIYARLHVFEDWIKSAPGGHY
jgi:secreted trypsin-like serine protease